MNRKHLLILCAFGLLGAAACGDAPTAPVPDDDDDDNNGPGGKTDTPEGDAPAEEQCLDRKQDVLNSAQKHFTPTAIRWACADVAGVNTVGRDDRGQEYCEYFSIIQPPPLNGQEGGELPPPVATGQNQNGGGVSALKVDLNEDQLFYLEDHPNEVVGQCVFTTWHADIEDRFGICEDDTCANSKLLGFPLNGDNFRMKVSFNSNSAASALVRDCMKATIPAGDKANPADDLHSDFYRGCMVTAQLYGTQWRRSDPQVCAAAIRLVECGCSLPDNADVPTGLVPPQPQKDADGNDILTLRGFPLGTWSGAAELPLGCRYVETGEAGQNLVACDLTAADLLVSADDPKGKCREKYGDNVVVHVPVPQGVISCSPPTGGAYADTCSNTPWVVEK